MDRQAADGLDDKLNKLAGKLYTALCTVQVKFGLKPNLGHVTNEILSV